MKTQRILTTIVIMMLLMFGFTTVALAQDKEITYVNLDVYWVDEVEIESNTKGVTVEEISGNNSRDNKWTTLTVTVSADDGYVFKRLYYASNWNLYTDSELKIDSKEIKEYSDNTATIRFKYYHKDESSISPRYSSYNNYNNYTYNIQPYSYNYGWVKEGSTWYYYENGSKVADSWRYISGCWYRFDSYGRMLTGWYNNNGQKYYLKNYGAMATGWTQIGNDWYYFDYKAGTMHVGWIKESNGNWYFCGNDGKMLTGWYTINGTNYHFKEDSPNKGVLLI